MKLTKSALQNIINEELAAVKEEQEAAAIIEEIENATEEYLDEWGLTDQFSVAEYWENLETLKAKIKEVMEIPEDKKSFDEW